MNQKKLLSWKKSRYSKTTGEIQPILNTNQENSQQIYHQLVLKTSYNLSQTGCNFMKIH